MHPIESLQSILSRDEILQIRQEIKLVNVQQPVLDYAHAIVRSTRQHPELILGASPRATIALVKMSQALCLFNGDDFVTPDHVQELIADVLGHRVIMSPDARFSGRTAEAILDDIVKSVPVPTGT